MGTSLPAARRSGIVYSASQDGGSSKPTPQNEEFAWSDSAGSWPAGYFRVTDGACTEHVEWAIYDVVCDDPQACHDLRRQLVLLRLQYVHQNALESALADAADFFTANDPTGGYVK